MSIFAGALSDRWNKKITMLASDSFAALCTAAVLILMTTGELRIWHLYLINALNGLMNCRSGRTEISGGWKNSCPFSRLAKLLSFHTL